MALVLRRAPHRPLLRRRPPLAVSRRRPMSEQFNWRKYLRVHPAADKLPMMEETELEELADDIKANGLRTGITIWGKKPDQPDKELPVLIDGRNRLDAVAQAGMLAVNNQGHLCIRTSDDTGQGLRLIKYNYREGDPHKLSRSLNVIRRHLSPETKHPGRRNSPDARSRTRHAPPSQSWLFPARRPAPRSAPGLPGRFWLPAP